MATFYISSCMFANWTWIHPYSLCKLNYFMLQHLYIFNQSKPSTTKLFASRQHYLCINGVTEFPVWRNKLEHHENVDFQRLWRAVSSYHHSWIRLLRHAGLALLAITFMQGCFLSRNAYFSFFFFRKKGRWVGKTLLNAPLTFTFFIYRR